MDAAKAAAGASAAGPLPWGGEGVVERLRHLWTKEHASASVIADDLAAMTGVRLGRNAVMGKIARLGLTGQGGTMAAAEPQPSPPTAVEHLPFQAPAKPPAEAVAPEGGYRLIDMRRNQCRFSVSPHEARDHRFCGAPVETGSPWCAEHAAVVFDRRPAAERRVKAAGPVPVKRIA